MQVNKYIFMILFGCINIALGMDDYNPQEMIKVTSFFYSVMAGRCVAYQNYIEFCDYQDATLRHGVTFNNAKKLIERYQKTSKLFDNPLEDLLNQDYFATLPKIKALSFLHQNITLQEAKEIQLFYFYKLMEKSKIRAVQDSYLKGFLNAIYAIYYGAKDHFNDAMQTIEKTGRTMPSPLQRIERYGTQPKTYQCFQ